MPIILPILLYFLAPKGGIVIEDSQFMEIMDYEGLAFWPFIMLRNKGFTAKGNVTHTLNHERIHLAQMVECAILPFYFLYFGEYAIRICREGDLDTAYRKISFEAEAYAN